MKRNRTVVTTLSVGAAIALTASTAGVASAAAAGHPKPHKPRPKHPVTQVTGKKLAGALLPASAFGSGLKTDGEIDTGNGLWSSRVSTNLSSLKCDQSGDSATLYLNDLVVNAGTNVYSVAELTVSNGSVPSSLLTKMIRST